MPVVDTTVLYSGLNRLTDQGAGMAVSALRASATRRHHCSASDHCRACCAPWLRLRAALNALPPVENLENISGRTILRSSAQHLLGSCNGYLLIVVSRRAKHVNMAIGQEQGQVPVEAHHECDSVSVTHTHPQCSARTSSISQEFYLINTKGRNADVRLQDKTSSSQELYNRDPAEVMLRMARSIDAKTEHEMQKGILLL